VTETDSFFRHFASLRRTPLSFSPFLKFKDSWNIQFSVTLLLFCCLAMHANVWMLVHFDVIVSHKTLSCERSVEKSNDYLLPS